MKRRTFLKSVCGCSLAAGLSPVFSKPETCKPNIILIISDDAGYVDFGFHGQKNSTLV